MKISTLVEVANLWRYGPIDYAIPKAWSDEHGSEFVWLYPKSGKHHVFGRAVPYGDIARLAIREMRKSCYDIDTFLNVYAYAFPSKPLDVKSLTLLNEKCRELDVDVGSMIDNYDIPSTSKGEDPAGLEEEVSCLKSKINDLEIMLLEYQKRKSKAESLRYIADNMITLKDVRIIPDLPLYCLNVPEDILEYKWVGWMDRIYETRVFLNEDDRGPTKGRVSDLT